jgi:hypothetical protein
MIRTKQEAIDLCIKQAGKGVTQSAGELAENTSNNTKGASSSECNNREVTNIWIKSISLILSTFLTVGEN